MHVPKETICWFFSCINPTTYTHNITHGMFQRIAGLQHNHLQFQPAKFSILHTSTGDHGWRSRKNTGWHRQWHQTMGVGSPGLKLLEFIASEINPYVGCVRRHLYHRWKICKRKQKLQLANCQPWSWQIQNPVWYLGCDRRFDESLRLKLGVIEVVPLLEFGLVWPFFGLRGIRMLREPVFPSRNRWCSMAGVPSCQQFHSETWPTIGQCRVTKTWRSDLQVNRKTSWPRTYSFFSCFQHRNRCAVLPRRAHMALHGFIKVLLVLAERAGPLSLRKGLHVAKFFGACASSLSTLKSVWYLCVIPWCAFASLQMLHCYTCLRQEGRT